MRTILKSAAARLHVDYVDDWRYGTTAYQVKGPRVAGTFVVVPNVITERGIDPDHPQVCIEMGASDRSQPCQDWQRRDRPVVNGVRLLGSPAVNTAEVRERPLTRDRLTVRRALGGRSSDLAPDATADRTAAVIDALLQHWLTRPEVYALRLHAAQAATDAVRAGLGIRMRRAVDLYAQARSDIAEIDHQLAALEHFDVIAHVLQDAA